MALNFDTLMADYNGTALAAAGAGEWGYVTDHWRLAIPAGWHPPDNYVIGTSPFADAAARNIFMKANYHQLVNGGVNATEALFATVLRMHIAEQGTLAARIANRAVIEDEYVDAAHAGANWDDAANNIPANAAASSIAKFVKRFGNTLIHHMVYVFLARGHHWRQEFNDLYDRLKIACFVPQNPGFQLPANEVLYRSAIHSFGIKPLLALVQADRTAGKLAAAMELRFSPHAPIAGVAHITTLKATLNQMTKEPWWDAFFNKFVAVIGNLDAAVVAIGTNPIAYHVSARVLGAPGRIMPDQDANAAFDRLCQFALGYIDHLGRRHSLAGQMAITKKSGGPTGLADAFSKACDIFGKPGTDVDDMNQFLAQI